MVWSCNQDPFLLRQDIHEIFGLPEHQVRVHTLHIGGGFGATSFCKLEPLAVLLARKAGAPIRLALSMDESLVTLSQHAARLRLRTAVGAYGTFLARCSDILLDGGAYADASALVSYLHLSNGPTLSLIFETDLAGSAWSKDRRRHASDMLHAYLKPNV